LDGIICSGARRGKQFTYSLLDERSPQVRALDRDEALAELARRYFTSHGPATLQDFAWWSGLTVTDAKSGLEMISSQLMYEVINNQAYWFTSSMPPANDLSQSIYLLPNYDEYTVGYTDRTAIVNVSDAEKSNTQGDVLNPVIVRNGLVIGTWKRTIKKDSILFTPNLFTSLDEIEKRALAISANRYGTYLNMPVNIEFDMP
ncbi:MAG TPA: crosslink repair DNA glycosylase YcaQ family protein, partial [Ktedonobacteraceae bacterium]|nr:crosslink repair DNA glycosylase YcaQ family protein [Ktedonobacteraceae bacterium]